jgi:putative ABC transport system permease protein
LFKVSAIEGRVFGPGDIGGAMPVTVVTRGFANSHFGDQSPVGKRIRIGDSDSKEPWLTIVGVVPDVWFDGTENADALRTAILTPLGQGDYRFVSVALAAKGDPMSFAQPVQASVNTIDPDQPIYFVRTLQGVIHRSGWFFGVFGTLFMIFGGAALFLATVGVYGVMSFSVSRRTQEIGLRMALGASARDVVRMFLRQGGIQVVIGLSAGLVLAFFLAKGLGLVMFQVNTKNPLMYAGVTTVLALTSLLATFVPARRAMTVDPMVALRYE